MCEVPRNQKLAEPSGDDEGVPKTSTNLQAKGRRTAHQEKEEVDQESHQEVHQEIHQEDLQKAGQENEQEEEKDLEEIRIW